VRQKHEDELVIDMNAFQNPRFKMLGYLLLVLVNIWMDNRNEMIINKVIP